MSYFSFYLSQKNQANWKSRRLGDAAPFDRCDHHVTKTCEEWRKRLAMETILHPKISFFPYCFSYFFEFIPCHNFSIDPTETYASTLSLDFLPRVVRFIIRRCLWNGLKVLCWGPNNLHDFLFYLKTGHIMLSLHFYVSLVLILIPKCCGVTKSKPDFVHNEYLFFNNLKSSEDFWSFFSNSHWGNILVRVKGRGWFKKSRELSA